MIMNYRRLNGALWQVLFPFYPRKVTLILMKSGIAFDEKWHFHRVGKCVYLIMLDRLLATKLVADLGNWIEKLKHGFAESIG